MEEEKVIFKVKKQNKIKLAYNFSNLNSEGPLGLRSGLKVILWFSWITMAQTLPYCTFIILL